MNWLRRILSILLNQTNENRAKKGKRAKTKEKSQKTQDFAKSLQGHEQVRRLKQAPSNKTRISVYKEEETILPPLPTDDKNLEEATGKSKSAWQSNAAEANRFNRTIEDCIQKGQKVTKSTSLNSGREEAQLSNRTGKRSNISKHNCDRPYHDCGNTDTDIHHLKELVEEDIQILEQPEDNHPLEPTGKIDDNGMLGVVSNLILPKLETVNFVCVKEYYEVGKLNLNNKIWIKILFRLNKRLVFKPECCLELDPKQSELSLIDISKVQLFWGQVNFLLVDYESPKLYKSSNTAKDYNVYSYIISKIYDFKQILYVLLTKKDFVLIDTEDSSFKKSQSYLIWLKLLVRLKRRKVFEPQHCLENYLSQSQCYLIDWESVKMDLKIVNFLLVDYTPVKSFYRSSKAVAKNEFLSNQFEYLPSQRYPLDFRLALKGLNLQTWSNPSLRILPAERPDGVDENRTNTLDNHSEVESLYQSKRDKNGSDCMDAGVSDIEPITDPKGLDTTENQTSQRKYITKADWGKRWINSDQKSDSDYIWIDLSDPSADSTRKALYEKLIRKRLIGLDLLQIAGDQSSEKLIFEKADRGLSLLCKPGNSANGDLKVEYYPYIAAAATMTARKEYVEKRFYDYLLRYLPNSSKEWSVNKVKKIVRDVAEYFSQERKIDVFIRQSIVPDNYLNEFVDYLYKIYSQILNYSIPSEVDNVLKQVFADQRKKINGERSASSVGSMNKLIKGIYELVLNKNWHLELVEYSKIVLQWIDAYFWENKYNDSSKILRFPEYFKSYFDSWKPSVLHEIRQIKGRTRLKRIWKPEFRLYKNQVQLKTPSIILFKAYRSLKIFIYNGDNLLIEKDGQIKSNIVNGNKVLVLESFNLEIDNPLDSLRLIISSGDERIYDSIYDLNRSVILFDSEEEAKELRATNNLPDQVFCVVPKDKKIENVEILKSSSHYDLGYINLIENEVAIVGELVLTQQNQSTVSVVGQKIKGYSISFGRRKYPVYKSIECLKISTTNNSIDSLFLKVENKNYPLGRKDFINSDEDGSVLLKLEKYIKPGFQEIRLIDRYYTGVFKHQVFYDPNYNVCLFNHNSSEKISVSIDTDIFCDVDEDYSSWDGFLELDSPDLLAIQFRHPRFAEPLIAYPRLNKPFYKIDDNSWRSFDRPLMVSEISPYSKIWFKGIDFKTIVASENNRTLYQIDKNENDDGVWITCEAIISHIEDHRSIELFFTDTDHEKPINIYGVINLYLKTFICSDIETSIDMEGTGILQFELKGPHAVSCKLTTKNGKVVARQECTPGLIKLTVPYVDIGVGYKLFVGAGDDDLFSDVEPYTVIKQSVEFNEFGEEGFTRFSIEKIQFSMLVEDYQVNSSKSFSELHLREEPSRQGFLTTGFLILEEPSKRKKKKVKISVVVATKAFYGDQINIELRPIGDQFVWNKTKNIISRRSKCKENGHTYKDIFSFFVKKID